MHFTCRGQAKAWMGGCLPSVINEPMFSEKAKSSVMAITGGSEGVAANHQHSGGDATDERNWIHGRRRKSGSMLARPMTLQWFGSPPNYRRHEAHLHIQEIRPFHAFGEHKSPLGGNHLGTN